MTKDLRPSLTRWQRFTIAVGWAYQCRCGAVLWANSRLAHDEDHDYADDESAWTLTTTILTDRLHTAERARDEARTALATLVAKWREQYAYIASVHATMGSGWKTCADELEAVLSKFRGVAVGGSTDTEEGADD